MRVMRRNCNVIACTLTPWYPLCKPVITIRKTLGIIDFFTLTESHKTICLLSKFPGEGNSKFFLAGNFSRNDAWNNRCFFERRTVRVASIVCKELFSPRTKLRYAARIDYTFSPVEMYSFAPGDLASIEAGGSNTTSYSAKIAIRFAFINHTRIKLLSRLPDGLLHAYIGRLKPPTPSIGQPSPVDGSTTPWQHVRSSGFLRCGSDGMELALTLAPGPCLEYRQLQIGAENSSFCGAKGRLTH